MIHSFLAGGIFRFALRFIPSVFEKVLDVISEYMMQKQSIEYDRLRLELAKIQGKIQLGLSEIKEETPIRLSRIKSQQFKSGIKWIDGFNALMRPLTTLFWVISYPLLVLWCVKEGIFAQSPLSILSPFEQDIIACILGFWYTDKIVQKKSRV